MVMNNTPLSDNPKLLKLWDSEKNSSLLLASATADTKASAWWVGECGHHWERDIDVQAKKVRRKQNPCPYCSNERTLRGFNDACSKIGGLSAELVNHDVRDVHYRSHRIYKWRCFNKHTYYASPAYHSMNLGCPWCALVVTLFVGVTILVFGASFVSVFL